jgi:hypothetical protein
MITIFDPVSGEGYNLDPVSLTASKMRVAVSVKQGPNSVSYSSTASSADGRFVQVYAGSKTAVGEGFGSGAGGGGRGAFVVTASGPNAVFTKSADRVGKREDLGSQNMAGVIAQGTRNTLTIEAGEIGNDRPIQVIDERWYSPDLQLEVMNKHSDPRTGEQITQMVNIQRGEPDPSLFQVPAAYRVIEPKAPPPLPKLPQQ